MPGSETGPQRNNGRALRADGFRTRKPPDKPGRFLLHVRGGFFRLCRWLPSLILMTMEGNPGGGVPADRPDPPRHRWRPADRVRASDADREAVISQLSERYAEGRLTHDTLDQRLGAALKARYRHDLEAVMAGLPSAAPARQHRGGLLEPGPDHAGRHDDGQVAAGSRAAAVLP